MRTIWTKMIMASDDTGVRPMSMLDSHTVWAWILKLTQEQHISQESLEKHIGFLYTDAFWCLNGIVIRQGLSNRRSSGDWLKSGGCWKLWIVESMSFSGYFIFKNIPLKLHSWKNAFGVDDKCFAWSNIALKSDPFVPVINMALVVEGKPLVIQQNVLFKCDLCDTKYIGYMCCHLHQRVDDH